MTTRLPPLSLLATFEAAARHLSFSHSARELNVQQPAISRQIATLEQDLRVQLFHRSRPRLTLTPEGEALYSAVVTGFDAIQRCADALRESQRRDVLVVNAALGFTSFYLLPRLGEFQSLHPEIRLEVVTRDQNDGYDPTQCDVVVTFGEAGLPGAESRLVFREVLVAVCAPRLLANGQPFELSDLAQQRLLYMSSDAHASDWSRYFAGTGFAPTPPDQLDRLFSHMVYLHAIQSGNGIGLGWIPLIDDLIDSGQLALACARTVQTKRGYHCSVLPRATQKAGAAAFLDWLC